MIDKPVTVVIDRGRVWIKRGVQSFLLDYEGETDDELNWYAQRLREALSLPAPPVADLPALPALEALARRCLWIGYVWNDHNFDSAAHIYAKREAEKHGITSFEQANEWLEAQPAPDTPPPDAYEIMRLADAYAKAEAARHIPTGDLYRSITHDDWVKKRDALYTALAAQAEAHAAEVAWLTAERDALRADAERLREFDAWLDDRAGPLLHIDDVRAARTGSKT